MKKPRSEFEKFQRVMGDILKVPHSEIRAQLDAEKAEKKRKKARRSSASGRAASEKD